MSRVVRGLGPAPDGRGINTPKEIRKYEKASRLFRRAEKAFNTIKKLRKRKKQQKGTPKADRIQQRINRLKERKDKLLEKSRSIKYRDRPKDYGSDRVKNPRRDRDRDRGRDRGRDKDIVSGKMISIRDRGRDRDRDRDRGRDRGRDEPVRKMRIDENTERRGRAPGITGDKQSDINVRPRRRRDDDRVKVSKNFLGKGR